MSHRFKGCGIPGNSDVEMVSILLSKRCQVPKDMLSKQDTQLLELFSRAIVSKFTDDDYLYVFIHEHEDALFDNIRYFINTLEPHISQFVSAQYETLFFNNCIKRTRGNKIK